MVLKITVAIAIVWGEQANEHPKNRCYLYPLDCTSQGRPCLSELSADMFKHLFIFWENTKYSGQAYCILCIALICNQGPCWIEYDIFMDVHTSIEHTLLASALCVATKLVFLFQLYRELFFFLCLKNVKDLEIFIRFSKASGILISEQYRPMVWTQTKTVSCLCFSWFASGPRGWFSTILHECPSQWSAELVCHSLAWCAFY